MAVADFVARVVRERAPAGDHRRPGDPRQLRGPAVGGDQRRASCCRPRSTARPPRRRLFPRGGMGALTDALAAAARAAGAEIRTGGAGGAHRGQGRGRHRGGAGERARRSPRAAVVSSADPHRTFLRLLDAASPGAGLRRQDPQLPLPGHGGQGQPGPVPAAALAAARHGDSRGRVARRAGSTSGPDIDYLERAYDAAKYGEISPRPYLDVTIPTLLDPQLAPAGRPRHVHPRPVRPYPPRAERGQRLQQRAARRDLHERERGRRASSTPWREYAPDLPPGDRGAAGAHPAGPRAGVQPDRRAPAARRAGAGSAVRLPAAGRLGAVPQPDRPPVPVRLGDPPGRRRQRRLGRQRQPGDPQGPAR